MLQCLVTQLCLTLCDPIDCSPPGSVHGISQTGILECIAVLFSRGSSQPRVRTQVSHIAGGFFISCVTRETPKCQYYICICSYIMGCESHSVVSNILQPHGQYESESEVTQSCLTLCNPMDCSLLGSSIHGIFQARVLEWIAISFSRESS